MASRILALNDTAVRHGRGKFFYLPETTALQVSLEPGCIEGLVEFESLIPNVLLCVSYVDGGREGGILGPARL